MNIGDLIKYYETSEANVPSSQFSSKENENNTNTQVTSDVSTNNDTKYPKYVPYKEIPQQHVQKKKQNNKVNKQKQYAFRCETCDKSFKDQKKYDEHMKSHVKCVHEGCSFSAPRQFMKHHELLHKNNMAKPLETPEEIAKYIEERKKRFPTRERIEQKKKEEEEKKKLMNDTDKISTKKKKPCIYFKKGNCRFGDECSFQHIKKRQRPNNFDDSDEDSEDFYPKSRNKLRKPKPVSSSKLIQNIVKTAEMKEIKAILQCIHFIVERNFLQGEN